MKKWMILAAMLVLMLVAAAPVVAQVAFEIEGNNNNACLGQLQFGNTGNFTNQQGALQYDSEVDDLEFGAPEIEFAPENETACEQAVQQSAAASSFGK